VHLVNLLLLHRHALRANSRLRLQRRSAVPCRLLLHFEQHFLLSQVLLLTQLLLRRARLLYLLLLSLLNFLHKHNLLFPRELLLAARSLLLRAVGATQNAGGLSLRRMRLDFIVACVLVVHLLRCFQLGSGRPRLMQVRRRCCDVLQTRLARLKQKLLLRSGWVKLHLSSTHHLLLASDHVAGGRCLLAHIYVF
jgi:hypothetical protein